MMNSKICISDVYDVRKPTKAHCYCQPVKLNQSEMSDLDCKVCERYVVLVKMCKKCTDESHQLWL